MRKKILVIAALIITMLTAACGMSAEQIDSALTEIETNYQGGVYEQIPATLEKLDKAYNNMSDTQKSKFTELRPLVDNAVKNAPAIKEGLEKAQGNYDQKMYYEAQQELDQIKDYQMPPVEKTKYDDLQANVSSAICTWKITEALQKIEALYNSGDYDLAATTITELDISAATEEQKQQYQSLQNKINNSKLLVQAEGEYNGGSYTSASNTVSQIDAAYLSAEQNQRIGSLKQKITNAQAEAERKRKENSMPAYVRQLKKDLGVPDSLEVTYTVSEPYYWAAGERNLIWVTFYHNGNTVAGAQIDETTHEAVRSIMAYNG